MITVAQAREALDKMYEKAFSVGAIDSPSYFLLEEFIKQYEDWVKVKKLGSLLVDMKPKEEDEE